MNDRCFIDSNVCLYAFDKTGTKKRRAMELLIGSSGVVSTQVLMETANVSRKKLGLDVTQIKKAVDLITSLSEVQSLGKAHVDLALFIHGKYHFSLYDSLIVATALLSGCIILYSEDMQHNQRIEDKLTNVNQCRLVSDL